MKMRKIIALLSALLMLCTLLPMSAFNALAAETPVYANNFENGIGGWYANVAKDSATGEVKSTGTVSIVSASLLPIANANADASVLKYTSESWNFCADKTGFTVAANTDYVFTYDILAITPNKPINMVVGIDSWFSTQVGKQVFTPSATEWQTVSLEFNSGSKTKLYCGWQAQGSGEYYIDNITITKKETVTPEQPEISYSFVKI